MAAPSTSRSPSISQYVLKVHNHCDLACDHCYVYRHQDQSWRGRAPVMTPATARAAVARIAEHAAAHGLRRVSVVLHGGEPLLLGAARLREILTLLRSGAVGGVEFDLSMQSNGVRLTADLCDLFAEFGVRLGISLDGDAAANDLHRVTARGTSSHERVLQALELLRRPAYQAIYGGILCTVDVRNDPVRVYEAVKAQRPPRVDFLLPHATWDHPPLRPPGDPTPYATWFGRIHERWRADGEPFAVRTFDSLRSLALGGPSGTESFGSDPVDLAVVETDGTWEQVDSLKTAYPGAPSTDLDVFTHSVDLLAAHPGILARLGGRESLCRTCRDCPVVDRCGGGLYAHRYRTGQGFDNPSVYCADLKELVTIVDPLEPPSDVPPRTTGGSVIPASVVAELGGGYGGPASLDLLTQTQFDIARRMVAKVGRGLTAERDPLSLAGWAALQQLDADHPEAASRVLAHPFVQAWALNCLHGGPADNAGHRPYLACLAAATAVRAGAAAEITVPIRHGGVVLPTLGRLDVPENDGETAVVSVVGRAATIAIGHRTHVITGPVTSPRWQPLRRLDIAGLALTMEDTDPYRDCYQAPAADRLTDETAVAWLRTIEEAWTVIRAEVPGQCDSLRGALRTIVPLRPEPGDDRRSGTARKAFGAIAVARTADAEVLAELMVHEVQHVKLGAVLDALDLIEPGSPARFRVGWRPDLRPMEGVLQGAYAHFGVADMWRARRDADRPGAETTYRMYRGWTEEAADALRSSGGLTASGMVFVESMIESINAWK